MAGMKSLPLLTRPSAWLPMLFALGALTLPFLLVAILGPDPTGDEGAAAHTWQLLMAAQAVAIVFFLAKWLPREPKQTLTVFALQAFVFIIPMIPVYMLEHGMLGPAR